MQNDNRTDMKLTESKLRSLIREELRRLNEIDDGRMMKNLLQDLREHPAVVSVDMDRLGYISVNAGGRTFTVKLKDTDPVDRAPSVADPENWKATVREKGAGMGGFVTSQRLGSTWGYQDLKSFVVKAIENATR